MKNKILYNLLFLSTISFASYTSPKMAYESALEKSPKIISAKLQFDSKAENIEEIYARLYPQLNFNISYSNTNYEINELQIRNDYDIKETSLDYNLNLNQTIFDYSIYSQLKVEKTRLKLYRYDFETKKQELISEVLDLYMQVLDSNNKLKLLETNLEFNFQTYKLMEEKFKLNLVNKMDYLEADVDLKKIKIAMLKEKKKYSNLLLKLKELTKIEIINIPNINTKLFNTGFILKLEDLIEKKKSLENNLLILQSKAAVEMSNYEVDNAKSGHYPTLSFNASYTQYVSDDPTSDYENYGKAMIKLDIPLYKGGAISSKVKSKLLIKKAALEDLKNTEFLENTKLNEVTNELIFGLNSLNMYKDALNSSEIYLKSVELAYEKGLKSIVDLYEAKTKLFNIKYEYMKSIYDLTNSYVNFLIVTNNLDDLDLLSDIIDINEVK